MIAREGLIPIVAVIIAGVAVAYLAGPVWSAPLWIVAGFLLLLFRESKPVIPNVPLGVLSAVRQNTRMDYALRVLSLSGLSLPSFWLGLLILMAFVNRDGGITPGDAPATGCPPPTSHPSRDHRRWLPAVPPG